MKMWMPAKYTVWNLLGQRVCYQIHSISRGRDWHSQRRWGDGWYNQCWLDDLPS
jgi:hypothetical protein